MLRVVYNLGCIALVLAFASMADASIMAPALPEYQLEPAHLGSASEASAPTDARVPEQPSDQPNQLDLALGQPVGAVPLPSSSSSGTAPGGNSTSLVAIGDAAVVAEPEFSGWILEEYAIQLPPRVGNDLLRPPQAAMAV